MITAVDLAKFEKPHFEAQLKSSRNRASICRTIVPNGVRVLLAAWLIVSELITNAARHAFNGRQGGLIKVELLPSAAFLNCRISDNGSSDAQILPGRGLRIVDGLVKNLGGRIDHRFGSQGAMSVLIIPIGKGKQLAEQGVTAMQLKEKSTLGLEQ